jgi:hypothetical protein
MMYFTSKRLRSRTRHASTVAASSPVTEETCEGNMAVPRSAFDTSETDRVENPQRKLVMATPFDHFMAI